MSILKFSEHFQLIFDNSNVNNDKQIKQKKGQFVIFANFSVLSKLVFLILLREVTLESKVASSNRNSSAFLLHNSKIYYNVEFFSIFSQTFLELILATKIKTNVVETISFFVYQLLTKNIAYIMYLNT